MLPEPGGRNPDASKLETTGTGVRLVRRHNGGDCRGSQRPTTRSSGPTSSALATRRHVSPATASATRTLITSIPVLRANPGTHQPRRSTTRICRTTTSSPGGPTASASHPRHPSHQPHQCHRSHPRRRALSRSCLDMGRYHPRLPLPPARQRNSWPQCSSRSPVSRFSKLRLQHLSRPQRTSPGKHTSRHPTG